VMWPQESSTDHSNGAAMVMPNKFCPKCRALRDIVVSVSRRKGVASDGNPGEILTRDYHYGTCCSLLRSEEVEDTGVVEGSDA
jgi:hypothetical protein